MSMRDRLIKWLAFAVILLLAMPPTWAQDPTSACMAQLAGDASLHVLAQKTALGSVKNLTLPMLADTSKANAEDKPLLDEWSAKLKQCYAQGQAFRDHTVTAESKAILDAQQHALEALLAQLYAGELTYGEFNRGRQESYTQFAAQASVSAQKMFSARAAQALTAQQAALDAQRQANDSQAGTEAGGEANSAGRQWMNSDSYPAPASNSFAPAPPSPPGIATVACEKAGLGPNCTGK